MMSILNFAPFLGANDHRKWSHTCVLTRNIAILRIGSTHIQYFVFVIFMANISVICWNITSQWLPGDRMSCLTRLKEDIKFLEITFNKKHERFQVITASVDEIACRFIGRGGETFIINANITVSICVGKIKAQTSNFQIKILLKGKRPTGTQVR